MKYKIHPGWWYPHGATKTKNGVNFSIASGEATHVELLLFEKADSPKPYEIIHLALKSTKLSFSGMYSSRG